MASSFLDEFARDRELFMQEFAEEVTIVCAGASRSARAIMLFGADIDEEYVSADVVAIVREEDIACEKPRIQSACLEFHTLYRTVDAGGFVKLYLSRDGVREVAI